MVWVQQDGPSLLVFLFCIVWTGDTAALYVGRNFGRTKLSPRISPKKSWEGSAASLAGGLLIAAALVALSRALENRSISTLHFAGSLARWLGLAVVLNLFAQVGDLVESAIKRGAGVKDSGAMLPGHGGILDRIDALLLAAPVLWYAQWIQQYFRAGQLALKHICILGSTGSIGTSTLSIIECYPERFAVASLAAGANVDLAFAQCQRWRPLVVSMATETLAGDLASRLKAADLGGIEVVYGTAGTVHAATLSRVDFVVSAIVGLAGLEATYAAVAAGNPSAWPTKRPWSPPERS